MRAEITTFNALRHSGAKPGETVAIHGVGELRHLAIQFAAKMGFRTVAINRGREKELFARKFGADDYVDSNDGVTLDLYPNSKTNSAALYEDDAISTAYKNEKFRNTLITASAGDGAKVMGVQTGAAAGDVYEVTLPAKKVSKAQQVKIRFQK